MTTPGPGPTPPGAPGPGTSWAPGAYPPPAHGYAAPPYGAPPAYPAPATGYAPWTPPPTRPTEPLAVASLVASGASVVVGGISGPVGVGLGIAALRRIRRTGDQGRGLAIAGIWVGGAVTALAVLLVLAVVVPVALAAREHATTGSSGASGATDPSVPDAPGTGAWADEMAMPWFELAYAFDRGDCFATAPETYDMSDAALVDCAAVHVTEVLDRLDMATPVLEDLSLPDATYTDLLDRCEQTVGALVDVEVLPEESYADVYYPHPTQWDAGGRSAYCVLTTFPSATGSAVAGTFAAGAGTSV